VNHEDSIVGLRVATALLAAPVTARPINQLRTVVFPAIFEGTEGDFFMALTDSQQQEILAAARQIVHDATSRMLHALEPDTV
jgi:hypothetical protein